MTDKERVKCKKCGHIGEPKQCGSVTYADTWYACEKCGAEPPHLSSVSDKERVEERKPCTCHGAEQLPTLRTLIESRDMYSGIEGDCSEAQVVGIYINQLEAEVNIQECEKESARDACKDKDAVILKLQAEVKRLESYLDEPTIETVRKVAIEECAKVAYDYETPPDHQVDKRFIALAIRKLKEK